MTPLQKDEDDLLRSVTLQTAQSILIARQRAEQDLVAAKESLELRTAELERANALIRTIAENAASCLLMLDESGIATYMNPAAIEETGYTLAEFGSVTFHTLLHAPASVAGHALDECAVRVASEKMRPLKRHRDVFMRKNGSTFPVSCSLSPIHREGLPAGTLLEFRDITDEQVAHKALEDANRRKDQFLAILSHELRTPMTAVLGWARMLKMGLEGEEAAEAIDAIEKSAEIQAQLIDDVLDVSRIVAGKMTFHPEPVDLTSVLQAAMTTVRPAAAAKNIMMMFETAPGMPQVLGDEGRLQQVIWNLLSNAVKFTPRGGSIRIRIEHLESVVRLTVQDTGKGIEADYLPHVFEPFSQEDGTATRSHEGIGLGLSIVRSLVELHGGRIRAASEGAGLGSTFTVELPVADAAAVLSSQPHDQPSPISVTRAELSDLSGLRVLVIDDQDFTREVLTAILRRASAEVHAARSVKEGLIRFKELTCDIVVCDVAMPEEDGFDFLRSIRSLVDTSSTTPVIALTAFGRPEDRQHAIAAGFDAYLKKPVDPQELSLTVRRLASQGR